MKPGFEIFFTHKFAEYEDLYLPKALKSVDQEVVVDEIAIKKPLQEVRANRHEGMGEVKVASRAVAKAVMGIGT